MGDVLPRPWPIMKPIVFLFGLLLATGHVYAQTWCALNETPLLNGNVGVVKDGQFTARGVLSLCAKPAKPPYSELSYRYGSKTLDLSFSAPTDGHFDLESQPIMPRASVDALYFRRGEFTYAITDCNGMHCGTRGLELMVFRGKKPIAVLLPEPEKFERNLDFLDDIKGPVVKTAKSGLDFDER
jgi:hypothetical protein